MEGKLKEEIIWILRLAKIYQYDESPHHLRGDQSQGGRTIYEVVETKVLRPSHQGVQIGLYCFVFIIKISIS